MSSIVFIDSRVTDYQLLLAGLDPGVQVVMLDHAQDGLTQIAQALQGVSGLDAVHIVSYGAPGALYLGNTALTFDNMGAYSAELAALGTALGENSDILLYGSNVGSGLYGPGFINTLAWYTGADVVASTDATGAGALGGNWLLESSSGSIEAQVFVSAQAQQSYSLTLDTITGTAGADNLVGTPGNDTIAGLAGNDTLNGWGGIDTASYSGAMAGYTFGLSGTNITVTDADGSNGNDGVDTLIDVESASFSDGVVTFATEFRLNADGSDNHSEAALAGLPGGGFVAVWTVTAQDGIGDEVFAQRHGADGQALGEAFRVNSTTVNTQEAATVAALSGGGFVVAWHSDSQDGNSYGIYAQRYDSAGLAQGGEFLVNTATSGPQYLPNISALAGGGFVLTWASGGQDGSSTGIYGQRFDANGVAQGIEFQINTTTASAQSNPTVAALSGGDYMVVWHDLGQDGSSWGVYAQRFDASGAPAGGEFRVNSTTADAQYQPHIAALAGNAGYVVVWYSHEQDGSGTGVYAQRIGADGVPQGGEFRVNTETMSDQGAPSVTALSDGGFVVVWQSYAQDGSGAGVYAQRYDGAGLAQGGEFRVNSSTDNDQQSPAVAALYDGGFVVGWTSIYYQNAYTYADVHAQRYDAAGNKLVSQIVGDANANSLIWAHASGMTLAGGAGNDTLSGSAGDDRFDGGADIDTANYANAASGVTVSLAVPSAQATGGAGTDTLVAIENLIGSGFADSLTGDALANALEGGAGNDTLNGGAGDDALSGGTGNDRLDGGAGNDTVSYLGAGAAVSVNLATAGAQATGGSGSDTLLGIENLTGSAHDDRLTGNTLSNILDGGAGIDTMTGGDGSDQYHIRNVGDLAVETNATTASGGVDLAYTYLSGYTLATNIEQGRIMSPDAAALTGNALDNVLFSGDGNNTFNGGTGLDTVSYLFATGAVTARLSIVGAQATGGSGLDSFNSIERLTGSNFNDILTGSTGANILNGAGGADSLSGGDGADTLVGGAGKDSLTGGSGADRFTYNDAGDSGIDSASWDRITDFQSASGNKGDKIDLSLIDANGAAAGDQAFSTLVNSAAAFLATGTFSAAGQLYFDQTAKVLYGNTDADAAAEFAIELIGVASLTMGDFIL